MIFPESNASAKSNHMAAMRPQAVPIGDSLTPPRSSESTPMELDTASTISPPLGHDRLSSLSKALLDAFPSQEDSDLICDEVGKATQLFFKMNTTSRTQLDSNGSAAKDVRPHARMHPVFLAKRMLTVALCIQNLWPQLPPLSEPPRQIMERMVQAAVDLVTTNEDLFGYAETLECIILEGLYKCNTGSLRKSWLAIRRSLSAAQLMGLHRKKPPRLKVLDPDTRIDAHFTWFRLQYTDRMLCLVLGLPQSSASKELTPKSPETEISNLEYTHATVAARILERNESDPAQDDYALTEAIDTQMLDAANELEPKFWLPVNFSNMRNGSSETFWESMRFMDQLHHHILLVQLHLPYLCSRTGHLPSNSTGITSHQVAYSKLACTSAAREILTRFAAFRSFNNITASCRCADFIALVAAMALLLAHLDGHRETHGSLLKHQRVGDRAMMIQVLESMDYIAKYNDDALTAESATLLHRLMDVEEEAAQALKAGGATVEIGTTLELSIPPLGSVVVSRNGIISVGDDTSKQILEVPSRIELTSDIPGGPSDSVHVANFDFFRDISRPLPDPTILPSTPLSEQQKFGPALVAGVEDWAFQGVDAAFFDSLMRGSGSVFGEGNNDLTGL
ncbi:hypothetical protein EJ04DRAFT_557304 [Polyplosphaeria fusca]|uniref:Xylanolytic transcriptional activator regulatory domain-containing protein n=1 Tax=Polyplosphaeria fusca TaxID=682080 RepID=A0A9P4QJD9_9PLEO|nr:hypothetical protein EJ04DRAFT_557304 [Polyplosphaeria fusca]